MGHGVIGAHVRYMGRHGAYGLMSGHMVHDGDGSWLSVMAMVHEVRCMSFGDGEGGR